MHTLVAEAFLTKGNKTEIHHKDFNKLNNTADNLQYVSRAEHIILHIQERKRKKNEKLLSKVCTD